jgi:hypothetical protein
MTVLLMARAGNLDISYDDLACLHVIKHQTYAHPIFSSKTCRFLSVVSDLLSLFNSLRTFNRLYVGYNKFSQLDERVF